MTALVVFLAAAQAQPVVAIVVVDQQARESGYALEIDGWLVEDALPIDVAEGEHVFIVEPDGRSEPLDVAPGEAWEVTGAMGEAWMSRLDEEIRTDLIAVRGSEDAIDALAVSLDAQVVVDGDYTYLSRDQVLFDAPWVTDEAALAVDEVALVAVESQPKADSTVSWTDSPTSTAVVPMHDKAVAAPVSVVSSTAMPTVKARPATRVAEEVVATPAVPDTFLAELQTAGRYAGMHLCRDDVLWLHPGGTYAFRGVTGTWRVTTPGVVRMLTSEGDVLFRASISPQTGYCRDVWSPEETGDAMPKGYERVTTESQKRFRRR